MVHRNTITASVSKVLSDYHKEITDELTSILNYWIRYTIDEEHGGFYGKVNNQNLADTTASKGIVLNSRILWTFSAAYLKTRNKDYLITATRAYEYIINHFIDYDLGGVFWSVTKDGKMHDGKKQIYGLAFCIYGMSEYYKATQSQAALNVAIELFNYIEQYSFDKMNGGYLEAFTRNWKAIEDLRLSNKDVNEKKTMNTHLHVIEAYANLYLVWPDQQLKKQIIGLLQVFEKYIIDAGTYHLNLFMDENWRLKSSLISFGHDIEAAWLLSESAEITGEHLYIERFKEIAIKMADAATEGLDIDGGLWHEYNVSLNHWMKEKHSWPQAEAMVGFFNAYQLTGNESYLQHSLYSWTFIKQYIQDKTNGEWFWGVLEGYAIMQEDKAGFWKCPYHNARACMELQKRISSLQNKV